MITQTRGQPPYYGKNIAVEKTTSSPAVQLRGVFKRFDNVVAVEKMDLDISEGSLVTLLGPSGCGKTTILRMIAGLETPTEGDILIKGKRVNDTPIHSPGRGRRHPGRPQRLQPLAENKWSGLSVSQKFRHRFIFCPLFARRGHHFFKRYDGLFASIRTDQAPVSPPLDDHRFPYGRRTDAVDCCWTGLCSGGNHRGKTPLFFGLIYMDARRYPYLCGHATIGAVTTLIEAGFLTVQDDVKRVLVETPSGPMEAIVYFDEGKVESVAIQMVPSFVYAEDEILHVPGFGKIVVDTVCVGGFFVMVSADQVGLELVPDNCQKLIRLGMDIISAANRHLDVHHPTRPEVNTVDVTEFYDAFGHPAGRGRSVVIYGEAHMDRSPCGTGTAAKMTLFHHRGQLELNQPYYNNSPLGTTFQGRLVSETSVDSVKAVIAEIRGTAHITGVHEFIFDPRDPFPEGFLI